GDAIKDIMLRGGEVGTEYNFGELPLGSIGGFVYLPPPGEDCEGDHDGDDLPLANGLIKLYDSNNRLVAETRTGADGSYRFNNLPEGTDRIEEVTPEGLLDGTAHVGVIDSIEVGQLTAEGALAHVQLP